MSKLNGSGSSDSIATQWGKTVAAAVAGEVIGIENKHGKVVAVMLGAREFQAIVDELERHREGYREELGG